MQNIVGLRVAKNKKFGLLTNSDGITAAVWSKEHAHYMVNEGVGWQVITQEDAGMLKEQIDLSELPASDADVPEVLRQAIGAVNDIGSRDLGHPVTEDWVNRTINSLIRKRSAPLN